MRCSRCNFDSPPAMKFCGQCGEALQRACGACGAVSPATFNFCGGCGTSLTAAIGTQAAPLRAPFPGERSATAGSGSTPQGASGHTNEVHHVGDAERRQLTVMFCDLVDSTALSQQIDPEDLRELVLRYQAAVGHAVADYGGHVAQYLGDGVLVYFGYPAAFEDAPRRAALASLDILAAIAALDAGAAGPLRVRIGLHTGSVVAGSVGVTGRSERLAMGDTPNIAARIQALAAPGEALMSERTRALTGEAIAAESIGPVALRGIAEPVVLHRVLGVRSGLVGGEDATEHRAQVPFVGRDRELASLRARYQQAEAGEGQVVLIDGEPGMGKTRLVQTLHEWAEDRDVTWISVRCSALHTNTPLHPLVELFSQQLAAIEPGTDIDELARADEGDTPRRRVEQLLRDAAIDDPAAPALLSSLLGVAYRARSAANDIDAFSPERKRNRTLRLITDLLVRHGRTGVTVLVVEDLHWADPSTLELLARAVEPIARQRVLALFTHRPSFKENWESPAHLTRMDLRRLNEADVAALIDEWAPGQLPNAVRAAVIARTDGVPLFVEELTRALLADHASANPVAMHDTAAIAVQVEAIPSTLRDILMARLDALGSARETAQLAAVLGRQFRFAEIAAISTLPAPTLAEHLHHLAHAQILTATGVPPQTTYAFRHALVQEAAYDSLLRRHRRALHSRAADALAASPASDAAPERMARHLEGAGRWQEASDAYASAAEQASATWAYGEACELVRRALAALARVPSSPERDQREFTLLALAAPALVAHHGYTFEELRQAYGRMATLAAALGPPFGGPMLTVNLWGFHCVRGDREEALRMAGEIQQLADAFGDPSFAALAGFVTGSSAYYTGDRAAALAPLERAVTCFRQLGADRTALEAMGGVLFLACLVHAMVLCDMGRVDEGLAAIADAVAVAEEHGSPFHVLQALDYQIWAWLHVGLDLEEISRLAERAEYLRAEFDIGWEHAAIHVGSARIERGDHAAIGVMRATVEATRAKGESNRLALQRVLLARAFITLQQYPEAIACIDENLANCERTIAGFPASELHRLRGLIAWKQGEVAAAEAHVKQAMEVARTQSATMFELHAALLGAQLLVQQAHDDEAQQLLSAVLARFKGGFHTPVLREAQALHAQLLGERVPH